MANCGGPNGTRVTCFQPCSCSRMHQERMQLSRPVGEPAKQDVGVRIDLLPCDELSWLGDRSFLPGVGCNAGDDHVARETPLQPGVNHFVAGGKRIFPTAAAVSSNPCDE